jgi:hypothetical protein
MNAAKNSEFGVVKFIIIIAILCFGFIVLSQVFGKSDYDMVDGGTAEENITSDCQEVPVDEVCEEGGFERYAETCEQAIEKSRADCLLLPNAIKPLSGQVKHKSSRRDGCVADTWCFVECEKIVKTCY